MIDRNGELSPNNNQNSGKHYEMGNHKQLNRYGQNVKFYDS